MDAQEPHGGKTSLRCRYCGSDESAERVDEASERSHLQVIVACASCGRAFTALSAN